MPTDDIAISVRNISKTYRLFSHPGDRIKQFLTMGARQYHQEFTALRDVTFDIKKGESVGIIGHNGSGKSTLLQLICGILKPTSGKVNVNGRISALLELGAGFNPEFTGRENVYFQGVLMGFTHAQMDERFDDIAAFADIGEFLDQPVRTYSSGMFVRLAFAVATHVTPDVLLVDEALAVGDAVFQHKSKGRIRQLVENGTSLLVVSHDRNTVTSMCDRSILLAKGKVIMDGRTSEAFDYYHALLAASGKNNVSLKNIDGNKLQVTSGSGEAFIEKITLINTEREETTSIEVGTSVILTFLVKAKTFIPRLVLGFMIRDQFGQAIFGTNTNSFFQTPTDVSASSLLSFQFTFLANIGEGSYSISTALVSTNDRLTNNYESRELAFFFEVKNTRSPDFSGSAWINPKLVIECL